MPYLGVTNDEGTAAAAGLAVPATASPTAVAVAPSTAPIFFASIPGLLGQWRVLATSVGCTPQRHQAHEVTQFALCGRCGTRLPAPSTGWRSPVRPASAGRQYVEGWRRSPTFTREHRAA